MRIGEDVYFQKRHGDSKEIARISGISYATICLAFQYRKCSLKTYREIVSYFKFRDMEERLKSYWQKNNY